MEEDTGCKHISRKAAGVAMMPNITKVDFKARVNDKDIYQNDKKSVLREAVFLKLPPRDIP